ncbi:hypothetical protein PS710_05313 [Pseudomonas fluorescens]|uniref:PAS domain-containing protein n=1 Tax=Pseudomonas fluorescens TaxID=294 RepID=A0A5E7F5D3_PSEFL|nr:hypothetical protein PS710_05313 [Pseudomonas fluorescens]
MLAAIRRSMAVIEFTSEGKVITANENFLKTMHYSLNEVVGQHHSLFCHRAEADSPAYKAFWASLNRGEYHSRRFERKDKYGHTGPGPVSMGVGLQWSPMRCAAWRPEPVRQRWRSSRWCAGTTIFH